MHRCPPKDGSHRTIDGPGWSTWRGAPAFDRHGVDGAQPPRGGHRGDTGQGGAWRRRAGIRPRVLVRRGVCSLAPERLHHMVVPSGSDGLVPGQGPAGGSSGSGAGGSVAGRVGARQERRRAGGRVLAAGRSAPHAPHGLRHTHKTLMDRLDTPSPYRVDTLPPEGSWQRNVPMNEHSDLTTLLTGLRSLAPRLAFSVLFQSRRSV
jgi:hypothetical protein